MRVDLEKLRGNVESTAELLRSDPSAGHVRSRVSARLVENVDARSEFHKPVAKAIPIHERISHNGMSVRDTVPEGLIE